MAHLDQALDATGSVDTLPAAETPPLTDSKALVRGMARQYQTTGTLRTLALALTEEAIAGPWHAAGVRRVLRHRVDDAPLFNPRGARVMVSVAREE